MSGREKEDRETETATEIATQRKRELIERQRQKGRNSVGEIDGASVSMRIERENETFE